MGQSITARAHTNIALIKYWGKQNPELITPDSPTQRVGSSKIQS